MRLDPYMWLECGRKLENPEEIHTWGEHEKSIQETDSGQDSNPTAVTPLYYDEQRQAQVLQHDIRAGIID